MVVDAQLVAWEDKMDQQLSLQERADPERGEGCMAAGRRAETLPGGAMDS